MFKNLLNIDDSFSVSIDNIGDIDGNGYNDLVIGSSGDDTWGENTGVVFIILTAENNSIIGMSKIGNDSSVVKGLLDTNDQFGGAVSYLGDINNDGFIEIAVGAEYDQDGGDAKGAVWILSLTSYGVSKSFVKISDTQGGFTGDISGDAIFGTDIENIGDLDGDGVDELAIGSSRDMDGGSNKGAVWILFMNSDLSVKKHQKISDTQGGLTFPIETLDYFGSSVANIGDLNGDGRNEIAVGASSDDDGATDSGAIYILFLNANGTVEKHQKISNTSGGFNHNLSNNALFGESIDGFTDIDSDGKIEIVVGALKQKNQTLGVRTGAFFLIELNSDGTVSEDFIYTFAENCFGADLKDEDFFGGAVTVLNDDPNNIKFAIGAHGDSEFDKKGAFYIIDLGEITYTLDNSSDSTHCGANDGFFEISTPNSNTEFNISYEFNSNTINTIITSNYYGNIKIRHLEPGTYSNILVENIASKCIENVGSVEIKEEDTVINYSQNSPSNCELNDGDIQFSNLHANESFSVAYNYKGQYEQINATSNNNGELEVSKLRAGTYTDITITNTSTNCIRNFPSIEIALTQLEVLVQNTSNASCEIPNGSFEISTLSPLENYTISYEYQGNSTTKNVSSNNNSIILIDQLNTGLYENILLTNNTLGCSTSIENITIASETFNATHNIIPSSCEDANGEMIISNLSANNDYNITYSFDASDINTTSTSDQNGEITLKNLTPGLYSNITITHTNSNCSNNFSSIEIEVSNNFNPTVSIVKNEMFCGEKLGEFSFENLHANSSYLLSYEFETKTTVLDITTNNQGQFTLSGLASGRYSEIQITNSGFCKSDLDEVLIECKSYTTKCFNPKVFFTPNGDGFNDLWFLEELNYCDYEVIIFNRFGKQIAQLNNNSQTWDGNYNGIPMPSADYWYLVKYTDQNGEELSFKSHLTLKR